MKKERQEKKCLLIAPLSFYSYSEYIRKTLIANGYDVTLSNDEYPNSTIGKVMGKLKIPVLQRITLKTIKKKFLEGKSYDLVLIIKGRGMSTELIQLLKEVSPKVIGYSFDSFKYHSAPQKWFTALNQFYTFDYRDGDQFNIPIVELFSSLPEHHGPKTCNYELSAIVRNHSTRLAYIDKVLSSLTVDKPFIYIFEQNLFSFIQNFLRSPLLYVKFRKYIFFKPLAYTEYERVLRESNFTIDFAHPSQTGITIRSFEALSTQTKIITNNPFVSRNEFFNETNAIVFNNVIEKDVLKKKFAGMKTIKPEKYKRTIDHFINDMIAN